MLYETKHLKRHKCIQSSFQQRNNPWSFAWTRETVESFIYSLITLTTGQLHACLRTTEKSMFVNFHAGIYITLSQQWRKRYSVHTKPLQQTSIDIVAHTMAGRAGEHVQHTRLKTLSFDVRYQIDLPSDNHRLLQQLDWVPSRGCQPAKVEECCSITAQTTANVRSKHITVSTL